MPKEYDQIHIVSVNNITIFYFIILRFVRFNVFKIKSISFRNSFYEIPGPLVISKYIFFTNFFNNFISFLSVNLTKNKILARIE